MAHRATEARTINIFLASIRVPADEGVFCLFDGVGADIRTASEQAGVPFERVLETGITCIRITGNNVATLRPFPSQSNGAPLPSCAAS
jgi:hypothetical protein